MKTNKKKKYLKIFIVFKHEKEKKRTKEFILKLRSLLFPTTACSTKS